MIEILASGINFENHVKRFVSSMRGMQRILFVGTGCDINQCPVLASQAWKCIYTTNRSTKLADAFSSKDRQVRPISTKADYDAASTKLDHKNPLLIYLNGFDNPDNDPNDIELEMEQEQNTEHLRKTLSVLLKSDLLVELVVVGYDPSNPHELSPKELVSLMWTLSDNRVTIYGADEELENNKYIRSLVDKGIATLFSQNIEETLKKLSFGTKTEDFEDRSPIPYSHENLKNTVYIEGIPVAINQSLCYDFNKYGRVLTLHEMATGTISRMMQVDYFYQFLKRSPNTPQWYGYAPRNNFSVKREYEQELYDAVSEGLDTSSETPVVLVGQTSSGKSVALANLAYRIFQERKYPILYINNPDVAFGFNSPASTALDNILKEMRDNGGRVLVILDLSIYNLQRNDILSKLSERYNNRGHKVLFVGSAMYSLSNEKRYRVIQAPITLTENEKKAFKNLIIEKGKLPSNKVEKWMKANSDVDGLLSMLYRLVYELHPQLELGVKQEISKALNDTRESLMNLEDPIVPPKPLGPIAAQLIKLGLAPRVEENEVAWTKEDIADSLQPFSESLAVSSLFKLRMPMTMALHLLNIPDCSNRQKYRDVVLNAPWLYYAMDNDKYAPGGYYVSFRDPIDAKIYLNSINKNEIEQMHIVGDIIRTLTNEKDSFYSDDVKFLERLIRLIGPNSDDPKVSSDWYHGYGVGCTYVIDALRTLREEGIVEPQLVAQEITYIREYFGNDSQNDLQTQVDWLNEAIRIARQVLESNEKPNVDVTYWQQGLIDSITVESIFAELQLEHCYQKATDADIKLDIRENQPILLSYVQRSCKLLEIIRSQPENSYAYTALLSCFIAKYGTCKESADMYRDMAEVMEVVDTAASSIPRVEENEHYQVNKAKFLELFDFVCGSSRADIFFEELLHMGSGVGVYIKASTIIRKAGIRYNMPMDNDKRDACKQALDLLNAPEYSEVVSRHAASQYMRLQLTWLYLNGRPVFEKERQTTKMTADNWFTLYQICDEFRCNIIEYQPDCPYVASVYYIMALSCAQLGQYDQAATIWRDVREDNFYSLGRQRTWHVLSTPDGKPMLFTGTFNWRPALPEQRIYIKEIQRAVYYPSLQSINKSDRNGDASDLYIGTSFRGFSAFAKNWRVWRKHS